MSDSSQGSGWWLASDGKWYSPEQAPGPVPQSPAPQYWPPPAAPGYGPPSSAPGYGYGYGSGYPPYAFAELPKTNGLAVASLVCSFFFWIYGLGALLAIVFGFIARSQIKHSGGTQRGKGLALAGIIIGFASLVITAAAITVVVLVVQRHCHDTGNCTFNTTGNTGN